MRNLKSCSRKAGGAVAALLIGAATWVPAQPPAAPEPDAKVVRVWGYAGLTPQLLRWESAYSHMHPDVRFQNQLHGAATVMAGLYNGVADVALMGREIWPVETMAYHWVFQQQPFGVEVATAGTAAPGQSFTPVVIVNAKNPLGSISLSQLDAMYGSEHRNAPANIRTWRELGLKGEWANKEIHVYGFGPEDALGVFFRHDVLRSDFKPNPESHLLSDHDPGNVPAEQRITEAVERDPQAIGYTRARKGSLVKVLPIVAGGEVAPTEETLRNRAYPLTRSISIYFRRFPNKPVDDKVDEFVRFVLGPAGQELVGPGEGLLPLTKELAQKQLDKLNAPMPKDPTAPEKDQ